MGKDFSVYKSDYKGYRKEFNDFAKQVVTVFTKMKKQVTPEEMESLKIVKEYCSTITDACNYTSDLDYSKADEIIGQQQRLIAELPNLAAGLKDETKSYCMELVDLVKQNSEVGLTIEKAMEKAKAFYNEIDNNSFDEKAEEFVEKVGPDGVVPTWEECENISVADTDPATVFSRLIWCNSHEAAVTKNGNPELNGEKSVYCQFLMRITDEIEAAPMDVQMEYLSMMKHYDAYCKHQCEDLYKSFEAEAPEGADKEQYAIAKLLVTDEYIRASDVLYYDSAYMSDTYQNLNRMLSTKRGNVKCLNDETSYAHMSSLITGNELKMIKDPSVSHDVIEHQSAILAKKFNKSGYAYSELDNRILTVYRDIMKDNNSTSADFINVKDSLKEFFGLKRNPIVDINDYYEKIEAIKNATADYLENHSTPIISRSGIERKNRVTELNELMDICNIRTEMLYGEPTERNLIVDEKPPVSFWIRIGRGLSGFFKGIVAGVRNLIVGKDGLSQKRDTADLKEKIMQNADDYVKIPVNPKYASQANVENSHWAEQEINQVEQENMIEEPEEEKHAEASPYSEILENIKTLREKDIPRELSELLDKHEFYVQSAIDMKKAMNKLGMKSDDGLTTDDKEAIAESAAYFAIYSEVSEKADNTLQEEEYLKQVAEAMGDKEEVQKKIDKLVMTPSFKTALGEITSQTAARLAVEGSEFLLYKKCKEKNVFEQAGIEKHVEPVHQNVHKTVEEAEIPGKTN